MSPLSPARTIGLVVGAVISAAAVAAATVVVTVDAPGLTREPISLSAQPPATASVAVCTGPILASGRDPQQAALLTDAAGQRVTAGAADEAVTTESVLVPQDVSGGAGPVAVTVQPSGGERADLAAAGSARVDDADLVGFAASACVRAQTESWLVGGAGTTGAADLVVLGNPGDVPALVTLEVYGASGRSLSPVGRDILVAAGSQRVIPLAALALGEEAPIVRVTSTQAPVQAALQASLTRILTPGGVDHVAAVGAPEDALVIPGVRVALGPGATGAGEVPVSLRLLAPASDGVATVTVFDGSGTVGDPQEVPLTAGVPLQLDLSGLAVGTYTVGVVATTPVTGAVWATTGFDAGSDFGWFTGAQSLTEPTLVAVAEGPAPTLTLTSAGSADSRVSVVDADGSGAREISVAAGTSVEVPVEGGRVYRIDPGEGDIRAAVGYAGEGALAGYPVQPGDAAAAAILVYPR